MVLELILRRVFLEEAIEVGVSGTEARAIVGGQELPDLDHPRMSSRMVRVGRAGLASR